MRGQMPSPALVERQANELSKRTIEAVDEHGGAPDANPVALVHGRYQPQFVPARAPAQRFRQILQHGNRTHHRLGCDPVMRLATRTFRRLVDTAAQIGEGLRAVAGGMLRDAADPEAEDLRHACADKVGNNDKTGIV